MARSASLSRSNISSPRAAAPRRRTMADMPYSLRMNGSTGNVNLGNQYSKEYNSAWSVSFWVSAASIIGTISLVDKRAFPGAGWQISSSSGKIGILQLGAGGANMVLKSGVPVLHPGWNHVTVTFSGSGTAAGVAIYMDGVAVATTTTTDNLGTFSTITSSSLYLGISPTSSQQLNGSMTRVRIHSRALTATEVANLFYDDNAVAVEGEWLMNDGAGTVLTGTQGASSGTITTPVWQTDAPSKARSYGTAAGYSAMVASHGAAHYWKMDESSGNFLPTIGAINLNVIAVSPTYAVAGKLGNAAHFPVLATPARAETASEIALAGLQRVVIEAIVNLPNFGSVPTFRVLWESLMSSAAAGYFGFFADGGATGSVARALSYTNGNAGATYSEVPRLPQKFTHIAQVIDYSQVGIVEVSVYLDGVLSMTGTTAVAANTGNLVNTKLAVMCRNGGSLPCVGAMQHLAIYTGANSTLAQIQQRGLYVARFRALP